MFDSTTFDREIDDLINRGQRTEAEQRMLKAYGELKEARNHRDLEYVVYRLAHFYSAPDTENVQKAEGYFLEREGLSPGAYSKYQTALFYFYVAGDLSRSIHKIDEISPTDRDYVTYYSALALKGQALVKLKMFTHAHAILEKLLELVSHTPSSLPHGDEINFLETAIEVPDLTARCRHLLELIIPRMRSEEYRQRAKDILQSAGLH